MSGEFLLFLGFAYLLGSIPSGKIIAARRGIDIQKRGSRNIGFANVRRTIGWEPALLVLAFDILKGLAPVLIAKRYLSPDQTMVVALAAVAGHVFPVWLKLKGGKGVATGLGASLAINLWLGIAAMAVYLVGAAVFKKSAPSSMVAMWILPPLSAAFARQYFAFFLCLSLLTTWTHRTNIQQILSAVKL